MKIYVDKNYKVYTEETINEEITNRMKNCNYDGLYDYMADWFCTSDVFDMLPPSVQSRFFEYFKEKTLINNFLSAKLMNPCLAIDVLSQNNNAPRDNPSRGFFLSKSGT